MSVCCCSLAGTAACQHKARGGIDRMTAVIAFFIGFLAGAVVAFIFVAATYGRDTDDYYGGADHGGEN